MPFRIMNETRGALWGTKIPDVQGRQITNNWASPSVEGIHCRDLWGRSIRIMLPKRNRVEPSMQPSCPIVRQPQCCIAFGVHAAYMARGMSDSREKRIDRAGGIISEEERLGRAAA